MAASDAMLPRRLPIPQAVHLFKPQSRNVKTFLLGDLKGAVLFCEREQPPLPRSLLARRDNFALHWKSFSSSSLLISKLSTSTSAFALKCSGSSSLLHSVLRFSTLSGPIRPKSYRSAFVMEFPFTVLSSSMVAPARRRASSRTSGFMPSTPSLPSFPPLRLRFSLP